MFYQPNEAITFKITVQNQGNQPASDITVTNYVPAEFLGAPTAMNIMTMAIGGGAGTSGTPTIMRADNGTDADNDDFTIEFGTDELDWLMPGDLLMFTVEYNLSPTATPGQTVSIFSEISANDNDDNGGTTPLVDIDSTPDDMNMTLSGETEGANLKDDVLNEDFKSNPATDDEDDHDIESIMGDFVLPVELLSFTAKADKDRIGLAWITASELNNSHFEVERSEDAKTFKFIARIAGQGTTLNQTDYSFEDIDVTPNVEYYYRLKQVDTDGTFEYSDIRTATLVDENLSGLEVYPNPIGGNMELQVNMRINDVQAEVYIMDVYGQRVMSVSQTFQQLGWNTMRIDVSNLSAGIYYLADSAGNIERFIKLNE